MYEYIGPENDEEGCIEYKRELNPNINDKKIQKLITQMEWRIRQGNGKAIYMLGYENNGNAYGLCKTELIQTIEVLKNIIQKTTAKIESIEIKKLLSFNKNCGFVSCVTITCQKLSNDNEFEYWKQNDT